MRIIIKLLGLQKHSPTGEPKFTFDVAEEATVASVLESLKLQQQGENVVLLNGRQAHPLQKLQNEDVLVIFPVMEGG